MKAVAEAFAFLARLLVPAHGRPGRRADAIVGGWLRQPWKRRDDTTVSFKSPNGPPRKMRRHANWVVRQTVKVQRKLVKRMFAGGVPEGVPTYDEVYGE